MNYIIVCYLAVSMHANFNCQATVGVASSRDAEEYDVLQCGVYTDNNIDKLVERLQKEYPDAELIRR